MYITDVLVKKNKYIVKFIQYDVQLCPNLFQTLVTAQKQTNTPS